MSILTCKLTTDQNVIHTQQHIANTLLPTETSVSLLKYKQMSWKNNKRALNFFNNVLYTVNGDKKKCATKILQGQQKPNFLGKPS